MTSPLRYQIRTEVYVEESTAATNPSLTSGWVSLPARWADGITIQRGYQSESSSTPTTSRCDFTVKDNREGTWTGPNPDSEYFGRFGQGSPVRVLVDQVIDPFTRTVANSWGSTPSTSPTGALAWSQYGASSAASDWSTNGTAARHSIDAVNETRFSWLADLSLADCEVCFDFTVPITVTGDSVKVVALLRGETVGGIPQGIRVELTANTGGSFSLVFRDPTGVQIGASATAFLTTPTGRLRAQIEGQTVRAMVWDPAARGEPKDWDLIESYPAITELSPAAGWVGIRSSVSAANTNAKPIVFSYDNFTVSLPRYRGALADPEQTAGSHPNDTTMKVSAAGVIQAQSLRKSPAYSALRRAVLQSDADLIGYWPMEDSSGATSLASALPGGRAMTYAGGASSTVSLARDETILGSKPLPTFEGPAGAYFVSSIPVGGANSTSAGEFLAAGVLHAPDTGVPVAVQILNLRLSGAWRPLGQFMIELQPSGEMRLRVRDWFGLDVLVSSLSTTFAVNGEAVLFGMQATQVGANVSWSFFRYLAGETTPQTVSGTINSTSIGAVTNVAAGLGGSLGGAALGHIMVFTGGASGALNTGVTHAVDGRSGETAGNRLERLMREEFRDFSYLGETDDTSLMGPQPAKSIDDLIAECVKADMGLALESRGGEFMYIARTAMYHQDNPVSFDYGRGGAANELVDPFIIRGNDQMIVNDVVLKRDNGSEYRATLEDGPRSVSAVGTRDESETVNFWRDAQLEDQAWWRVALGTATSLRVATLTVDITRPVVSDRLHEFAALAPGRRVQLSNTPPWAPPEISLSPRELIVIGMKEYLDQSRWVITLVCMPGELFNVPVMGPVATGGAKVDTDGSYVVSGTTTTGTSITVASTWLWTTDPAQMPIPIEIGGEVITVTAVSGATSPQTFTITRSVNGKVKQIYANESVQLLAKPRFGY